MKKIEDLDLAGRYAATLSVTEVGVGSLLHAFHVPFTGQILSLNQIFILVKACRFSEQRFLAFEISMLTAILKTLSPAGKKLTPMLAIATQGLLFSIGTFVFGINFFGFIVGSILSGLWAFLQPALLYYFLYGGSFVKVFELALKELQRYIPNAGIFAVILIPVLVKIILSISVVFLGLSKIQILKFKFQFNVPSVSQNQSSISKIKAAVKDTFNPLFLISMSIFLVFLYSYEKDFSKWVFYIFRPLAFSFLVFLGVRLLSFEKIETFFQKLGLHRMAKNLKQAEMLLKENSKNN